MNLFYVQNSKDQNRHLLPLLFIYSCNIYIYKQVATVATLYTLKTKFTPHALLPPITNDNYVFVTDDGIVVARVGFVGDEKEGDKRYVANASIEVKTTSE